VQGDACIACGQCEMRCPDYAIFVDKVKEAAV
jgi:2-oxoglutarate ferredoxin oxidoreductase subunit delta